MKALVGYTGFVGSNIYTSGEFDAVYNSKNIEEAFGTKPDLLVYAGLRAEKFWLIMCPKRIWNQFCRQKKILRKLIPKSWF